MGATVNRNRIALMAVVLAAEVEVGEQTYVQNVHHFPHFFTPDFADELRKSGFLIVQGNFVRLLMSY